MTATDQDPIAGVRKLADTVLFEGYMLYPYRANDPKNQVRWQFGVLAPPAYVEVDPSERPGLQVDCLLEGPDVTLTAVIRFLHVQRRRIERAVGDSFQPADSLDVKDATYLPWDEAVVHESTVTSVLGGLGLHSESVRIHLGARHETEDLYAEDGVLAGRLVRNRLPLDADVFIDVEPLPGPYGLRRMRVRVENVTSWQLSPTNVANRRDALRHSLVAAHVILTVQHGVFVSLMDPPEWARGYADSCQQVGAFPVLAGPPGDSHTVLASPIILYDHPLLAPESASQFCDATEMDEMLTLRTLTLTDAEKRQVRGSDPRAARLVDEIDNLPPELMDRLHGAIRSMTSVARPVEVAPDEITPWWNPEADGGVDPETDLVIVNGVPVGRGTTVRLRPGQRRADAQDMFLAGRTAKIEAVLADVDGDYHLAVTLDDLAEDGYNPHGRFLYFAPDEVEPLEVDA
jgi:hypothetical protein